MHSRITCSILILLLLAAATPQAVRAQASVQVLEMSVEYTFNQRAVFTATVRTPQPVQSARIFLQTEGNTRTEIGEVQVIPKEREGLYDLVFTHDLAARPLRAFAHVTYHFEITLKSGEVIDSPDRTFYYEDNRLEWKTRREGLFRVHWEQGEVEFAQEILDTAQAGLERSQSLLPVPEPELIEIYVYSKASDLQATLNFPDTDWAAGHADPALGVAVVALPRGPDQRLLVEQRVPHEIMHILLYGYSTTGYHNLPTWLSEGLASAAELYPNPDYQVVLDNAFRRRSLLLMNDLCQPFPRDASSAVLAYAQSASFTRYLYNNYGSSGLKALVDAYSDGVNCERGARLALGMNLSQLERQWRQATFAENVTLTALGNLLPWLVLMLAALGTPLALAVTRLRKKPASAEV